MYDDDEMMSDATPISSNQFSTDLQVIDAMRYLEDAHNTEYREILASFPEYPDVENDLLNNGPSCTVDTERLNLDDDWVGWVVEAITDTGWVFWMDGEPFSVDGL